MLYTSLERDGALAEIGHRLALEPVWPSKIVHAIHELRLRAERAINLPDLVTLERLGVDPSRYAGYSYGTTHAVAAAAQFLGYDAMIVPNARFPCLNAVVLLENLDPGVTIEVVTSAPVDWAAWRGV